VRFLITVRHNIVMNYNDDRQISGYGKPSMKIYQRFVAIGAISALAVVALLLLAPYPALARSKHDHYSNILPKTIKQMNDEATLKIDPQSGLPGVKVTVTGSNIGHFCLGQIKIDGNPIGQNYSCGVGTDFTASFNWPTGLADGNHTVTAAGVFSSVSTQFTQLAPTPTPDIAATATVQAASIQATATAVAQAKGAAKKTLGGGSGSLWPALLVIGILTALGAITMILLLVRGRRPPSNYPLPSNDYPSPYKDDQMPPSPSGDQWIWPVDPRR
jgi:hypothetical protein